jgi:hypothetical protein
VGGVRHGGVMAVILSHHTFHIFHTFSLFSHFLAQLCAQWLSMRLEVMGALVVFAAALAVGLLAPRNAGVLDTLHECAWAPAVCAVLMPRSCARARVNTATAKGSWCPRSAPHTVTAPAHALACVQVNHGLRMNAHHTRQAWRASR